MNVPLSRLWQRARWLLIAFVLALALTLYFAIRLTLFTLYWNDPAHHNQPVAGWMPLGYIAHSWQLDPQDINAALKLPPGARRGPVSLEELAQERGVPVQTLIDALDTLIANRPARPPRP